MKSPLDKCSLEMEYLKNLPWWVFLIAAVFVVYLAVCFIFIRKKSSKKKAFRAEHPEAASVYAEFSLKGVKTVQISILQVDGAPYGEYYPEGTKQAYLLLPGKHVLEVQAQTQRPGVLYRNVMETFGPATMEIEVAERGKYTVGFDTKQKEFTFTEIA